MAFPWYQSLSHQSYWREFDLKGVKIKVKTPKSEAFRAASDQIPPYFWVKGFRNRVRRLLGRKLRKHSFPTHPGYSEARSLVGHGTVAELGMLSNQARDFVTEVFGDVGDVADTSSVSENQSLSSLESGPRVVQLKLSTDLQSWKDTQHAAGNILPPKGTGLSQASAEALSKIGATNWPEALKTNNALFGCGIASLLMGAADAPTMFSNYVTDMAFYYEHGYNYVFPTLEPLLQKGLTDPHALRTPGGRERRDAVSLGKQYIQGKIALENQHKKNLSYRSARLNRRTAQIVSLSESSLLGMAAEAIARGFDPAAVMADLVFSSPGTDVVDVGCDLVNSEVMNSFLNVTDITETGVVSEEVLRKVYDAYSATGARMLTQRWHEPVARMCAALYTWHIQNDRHLFFRRALMGWPKARKTPAQPQFEADFDEAFDKEYRTTGFSRPLDAKHACNGEDTCDHVNHFLHRHQDKPLLKELWWQLVTGPLEYVRGGQVDEEREYDFVEGSRLTMADLFSRGQVLEMVWLIAHANFHAWQVNYLFEAAMFGSILDGGKLAGKLDRQEESQD
ncbi:uncharacterized protein TRIVIDRAFT_46883 [Trichoderma virens Gv29-8]|uniref:Uncharacterized protein n=1 Tax=Hypocrea virens (strain Gv29-8 / FGSC 10586) TaxID=413071 RepID=G9N095_HYPVG|nr:uncharacterized protein TRIVIDRAFT_46883 [Trichoderma virens Gv29-8]EHK19777.1 hypothetical protein TRIVIDRAFT_46883 [Trichoderma virens Gv29-8]UKZ53167.1 hypothetical protein TrVGV298_006959 [Trichoderma virens]